jgi:hypothetical protein
MYPGLERYRARINRLPTVLKAALAAACAQRQAELYRAYVRRTGAGNSEVFDNLLTSIWDDICCTRASQEDRRKWEAGAEELLKQKTKNDRYGACAEFAILSLLYSNDTLTAGGTQDAIYSAHQPFNSIDNHLTGPVGHEPQIDINQPDLAARVFAHPLSQAEHHRQERDLVELEQALHGPDAIPGAVERIRRRSATEAKDLLPIIDGGA